MGDKNCYTCEYLDYYEKQSYEDTSLEGYFCNKRDDEPQEKLKEFPSKRKLRCWETKQSSS